MLAAKFGRLAAVCLAAVLCVLPAAANPQGAAMSCREICDATSFDTYLPQQCSRRCPGWSEKAAQESKQGGGDLVTMQRRLTVLQTRLDTLVVAVILLGVVVAALLPVLCLRDVILQHLRRLFTASPKKTSASPGSAKKRRWGSRRKKAASVACVDGGGPGGGEGGGEGGKLPLALRKGTVYTNNNPAPIIAQDPPLPTPRTRHPSESSCTAEAGYYNYGRSSSTLAVSPPPSRTSSPRGPAPLPLSPSALLPAQGVVCSTPAPGHSPSGIHSSNNTNNHNYSVHYSANSSIQSSTHLNGHSSPIGVHSNHSNSNSRNSTQYSTQHSTHSSTHHSTPLRSSIRSNPQQDSRLSTPDGPLVSGVTMETTCGTINSRF